MFFLGLSPCIRGKHHRLAAKTLRLRSIPVHTGETPSACSKNPSPSVYPRAYGGNTISRAVSSRYYGLSPCIRGKLTAAGPSASQYRSIPVHTGETFGVAQSQTHLEVYPRAYGGNNERSHRRYSNTGLSPCIRGKHK